MLKSYNLSQIYEKQQNEPKNGDNVWNMWLKLGKRGKNWHLQIQGAIPLLYLLWCEGTFKKRNFQKFSFLTNCIPKTEGREPRSWDWPFSRHFQDIYISDLEAYWGIPNDSQWSYDRNWWASVCFNLLRCLILSAGPKIGQR